MKTNRSGKASRVTTEQMDALVAAAPSPKYALLWRLQRETAGRIGECLQLRWQELNGTHVLFRAVTTKTKTTREVVKSDRLKQAIAEYRTAWLEEHGCLPADDEYVFPGRFSTAEPITRQTADLAFRKVCKQLGLSGVSLHSFRRTAAMDAADKGISVHLIRGLTGHASLDGLSHYLEVRDQDVLACLQ